ncbi:MAG: alpha-E domain-containing protein, partial [Gammaproteobacteria bacterium]
MLSRVAERAYWMARYAERAENTARIINVYSNLLLDLPRITAIGWHSLVEITGNKQLYRELYNENLERNIMKFLLADTRNPGSLLNSLGYARENARTIRGVIPRDGWEHLNKLYLGAQSELPTSLSRRKRYEYLANLIGNIQQLTGLLAGTMSHNAGYHFVRIGRNLERTDMTSRIIDTISVDTFIDEDQEKLAPYNHILWMNVLKSLSAYQSYRQEVQMAISRDNVLKFVLQNRDFPRTILHCLYEIQNSTQKLPRHLKPIRFLNQSIKRISATDASTLNSKQLHRLMDKIQVDVSIFHQHFSANYFSVVEIARASPAKRKHAQIRRRRRKADNISGRTLNAPA